MRIFVGLPMHNAADCVIEAAERMATAMQAAGAVWALQIVDDNSDPAELAKVRAHLLTSPRLMRSHAITQARLLWPSSRPPNLGKALNYCLAQVPAEADYYLNVESDVYLHPDTLSKLIGAMRETGAPMACPGQLTPDGSYDFIFWGAGIISAEALRDAPEMALLRSQGRPKWCNLGCLLVRGDVARNSRVGVDAEQFDLFCVDQDYTSTVAQVYGRPVYEPTALVTHVGRQSTKEGQPGGHSAALAVHRINQKWASYLAGGLFGQ